MSLSNMTKARYLEVRALVRANGLRYAKAHICPLEYADMVEIELSPVDWLEERQRFYAIGADPKNVDFRLTSWTTL